MQNIANPISLARRVMEATDHNLLVGAGANKFAASQGFETVPTELLVSAEAIAEFEQIRDYTEGVNKYACCLYSVETRIYVVIRSFVFLRLFP